MTNTSPKDADRRFWPANTAVVSGGGLTAAAAPFLASMTPGERACAIGAPLGVDLQGMKEGEIKTIEWRGQPGFVFRRSADMSEALHKNDALLSDPQSTRSIQPAYAKNADRSIKPELGVLAGICTRLGCIPTFRPMPGSAEVDAKGPGGFYGPNHASKFGLAGRVFRNVPAPTSLTGPPHHFASESRLLVGVGPDSGDQLG